MRTHRASDRLSSSGSQVISGLLLIGLLLPGDDFPGNASILACLSSGNATQQARMHALPGTGLQAKIDELIRASGAEAVAVAYYDLATGKELLINPNVSFHAASTMKVPVMMEIFRQAAAGKLSLDRRIPIKNDFASIVDGSHYSLTPDSDSDQSLYTRAGQTETIRELMRL